MAVVRNVYDICSVLEVFVHVCGFNLSPSGKNVDTLTAFDVLIQY